MASSVKTIVGKPISGKSIFYFIQSVHNKIGEAALMPAHRTSGDLTLGGDFIDEQSQQGRIVEKSNDEHEVELAQYFVPTDPSINVVREAQRNGDSVKVWQVIVDPSVAKGSGAEKTYPALFGYGKISELSVPSDIGDLVEVSYTLSVV
ncbi:phage major tail protein, TP901-1 family, partial [Escherichia coli]|nr:phage major tail protein, TP901-1 family [Escherichia coli]